MNRRRLAGGALGLAVGVAFVWLALSASLGIAADTAESVRPTLDKLLKAIEANDYVAFVADATEAVKTKLTKPMLEEVSAQYAPRMKKGFECTFLGELKQQGCQVTLWKLAFKDGGDDTLAKLVMKEGKVAGFWLQ